MTRRLVALHAETSPADLADGLAWYDRAQSAARDMAVGDDVARAATGDASMTAVSPALYRRVEAAYVAAARIVGLAPRDLQAAVWVHVRGAAD